MKKRIGIIGHVDHGKTTLSQAIAEHLINKDDTLFVHNAESVDEQLERYFNTRQFDDPIPYIAAPRFELYGGKDFICKGKHQYREVKETNGNLIKHSWVCQCGRKL